MKTLEKVIKKITGIVAIISYVGFVGIMLLTVVDIILRLTTGESILGVYEIVERTMVCAVFASFAYTQSEHGHVSITLLISKYPKKLRFIMLAFNNVLCVAASILVAYAAYTQEEVARTSNYTTGILYIPLFPFYWVEIVAMIVLAVAFLLDAIKPVIAIWNKEMETIVLKDIGEIVEDSTPVTE